MTYPRHSLVSLKDTPYYHCIGRCVRRAWLWGYDKYADKDYSHRKNWIVDRMRELCGVFAIECCAFAVLSNHYHTVLFVDSARAQGWDEAEVVRRWKKLFGVPTLVQNYLNGHAGKAEREAALRIIGMWRKRLMDVSWFMRCLNEHLARRANQEDDVTGRFWAGYCSMQNRHSLHPCKSEGRFKSQALLDEAGILTAMAYVDLNPIRAGIAKTPEDSEFTSIYQRIRAMKGKSTNGPTLRKFQGQTTKDKALPCSQEDYLALLDWTGRAIRGDKRGHIEQSLPPILTRLNIDATAWQQIMQPGGNVFGRAMGQVDHLRLHAKALGQKWIKGLRLAEGIYRTT